LILVGIGITLLAMHWDPFATLQRALWIGGGQWAGKSTVAGILAERHGLTHYHYDYHDARGHLDRRAARQARRGETLVEPDAEHMWIRSTVEEAVEQALAIFVERMEYVEDDLRALVSPRPIIADGWGLRPELVAPLTSSPERMVVMVPTEDFRQRQLRQWQRAGALRHHVSDPELAQNNRIARDRLIAEDAVRNAERLGICVIEVDGSCDAQAMADQVGDRFRDFLP
jgi:2-phosphoglycerate kinase